VSDDDDGDGCDGDEDGDHVVGLGSSLGLDRADEVGAG
jgi:hypothetical protein